MLAPLNDITGTKNNTLDDFFLPAFIFELDGKLKFANKAARVFIEEEASGKNKSSFSEIFHSNTDFWKQIISFLIHPDITVSGTQLYTFSLPGEKTCEAAFHLSSASEMPLIQCAIQRIYDSEKDSDTSQNSNSTSLQTIETIYKTITNSIPNGVLMVFDKNLRYAYAEGEGLRLFKLSKKDIIGKSVQELHVGEFCDTFVPLYKKALEGEVSCIEYKTVSGNCFYVSVAPLEKDGIEGGMFVAFNIHNFKKAEYERDKKIEELWYTNNQLKIENGVRKLIERNMYEQKFELELKNQELEQFAYVASHDLQEPLRMVSSYTQLLGNRYANKLDSEAQEFISYAVEGATRMQSLITDLLSYSRIGRKEMSFEKINLDVILQIVKRNLFVLLQETEAEIIYEKTPLVQADASQLVQLFQNLISNAIKFRNKEVKPVIKISAKNTGKFYHVCVQDNGIGLSMEYKDRIFHIFQRLHTRDKYPGTGIGLAICKKIVERHGGQIWVESEPGAGTKFYFTLSR